MDTGDSNQRNPKVGNPMFFVLCGFVLVIGFSILHLVLSGVLCFLVGFDFTTVIYVSAAALTTGTLVTMILALLISVYCLLTFLGSLHASLATAKVPKLGQLISSPKFSLRNVYQLPNSFIGNGNLVGGESNGEKKS